MLKLTENLQDYAHIYVGLSCGYDSLALSRLLYSKGFNFTCVHVNHEQIDDDCEIERSCVKFCRFFNIPLEIYRRSEVPELDMEDGISIECEARRIREGVWNLLSSRHKDSGAALLLAHHLDDAVESYFINMMRGHAEYMPIHRYCEWGNLTIVRPFLDIKKADICQYIKEVHLLEYVFHDPLNDSEKSMRSWFRNHIIPVINQKYPGRLTGVVRNRFYKGKKQ